MNRSTVLKSLAGRPASQVGFGGMELAGPPRAPRLEAAAAGDLLRAAFDLGINYFDTSIDYGASEERIGEAFEKVREEVIIASKCGCVVSARTAPAVGPSHLYTRANIKAGIEQSLRRLRTDYIDVMQLHGKPELSQLECEGGLDTLLDLQDRGVIRELGLSTRKPYVEQFIPLEWLSVFQLPYSAIQRGHEDLARAVADQGHAVVARGVVGRGSAANGWSTTPIGMQEGRAQTVWDAANLDELCGGMPRSEFLIRFSLSAPFVTISLIGTSNAEHLAADVRAAEAGPLDHELYGLTMARLSAAGAVPGLGHYYDGGPARQATARDVDRADYEDVLRTKEG